MKALAACTMLLTLFATEGSRAAEFQFEGYGDVRLVVTPNTGSYLDGELGKLRYGDYDSNFQWGDLIGEGRVLVTPELLFTATARANANYGPALDLIEAYVRYRPVSTNEWRWSVKAGAFFPPGSLENTEVGWSSYWTVTPSAINSWVGEELRIIGTEASLEWRRDDGPVKLSAALFVDNDPAGVMIADRGWTFDDRVAGLFGAERLPDATATLLGLSPPLYAHLFTEMDGRPGWYVDLSWEPRNIGSIEVMRYDNEADPTVIKDGQIAWHTRFWNAGFERQLGRISVLAQAMSGATTIEPSPFFHQTTDFRAAYLLAGYDWGAWRAAVRADVFQTRTQASFPSTLNEDGHAFLASLTWAPKSWLRFTGELLAVDDRRQERTVVGETPHQIETQFQLLARVYF